MNTILTDAIRTASKKHTCDACEWFLNSGLGDEDLTAQEIGHLRQAMADNWQIQPGQKYIYQTGVYEGDFYTVRARQDMHAICLKYDIYEE